MFSGIPGLYALYNIITVHPKYDNEKCSRHYQMFSGGSKSSPDKNHSCRQISWIYKPHFLTWKMSVILLSSSHDGNNYKITAITNVTTRLAFIGCLLCVRPQIEDLPIVTPSNPHSNIYMVDTLIFTLIPQTGALCAKIQLEAMWLQEL